MRTISILLLASIHHCYAQTNLYWQQEVNYSINATIIEKYETIRGIEEVVYINHSPDSIYEIYLHLVPNALASNKTPYVKQQIEDGFRGIYFAKRSNRPYMHVTAVKSNNSPLTHEFTNDSEFIRMVPMQPVPPGDSLQFTVDFETKIAKQYSRFGKNEDVYYMAHWYPKVCTYTPYGWQLNPYLAHGELIHEFGEYYVNLEIPVDYVIASSGELIAESQSDGISRLRFHSDQQHDFTWTISKELNRNTFIHKAATGKEILVAYYFQDENSEDWSDAHEYISDILDYYTSRVGDYPYRLLSIVEGTSGMEYPGIVVVDGFSGKFRLHQSLVHEIGHMWFFGALASDQAAHMWMDEGIVTYYEFEYMSKKYPDANLFGLNTDAFNANLGNDIIALLGIREFDYKYSREILYQLLASNNVDQPIDTRASDFTFFNYTFIGYLKASMLVEHLSRYIGDNNFDKAMQSYYDSWKFKHPRPEDLINSFKKFSDKPIDWFEDMLTTPDKVDFVVGRQASGSVVKLHSSAQIPTIVKIDQKEDWYLPGMMSTFPFSDSVWIDPYNTIPELRKDNNFLIRGGPAGYTRGKKFKLRLVGSLDHPKYREHNILPAFGYNTTDEFMSGLLMYNDLTQTKKVSYESVTLYAIRTKEINGSLRLRIRQYIPSGTLEWSPLLKKYAGFQKVGGEIALVKRKNKMRRSPSQIWRLSFFKYETHAESLTIYEDSYTLSSLEQSIAKHNAINGYYLTTRLETNNKSFLKLSFEYFIEKQFKRNAYLTLRGFAGTILGGSARDESFYFRASGSSDYQFNDIFINRVGYNEDNVSHQSNLKEGGIRSAVNVSSERIVSLNASIEVPGLSLIGIFGGVSYHYSKGTIYDYGLQMRLLKDIAYIYFPLGGVAYSNYIVSNYKSIRSNVRFFIDLNELNIFRQIEKRLGR